MSMVTAIESRSPAFTRPGPHVACVLDGSEASLDALAVARSECGAMGRLSVVLVDRWASLALCCTELAIDAVLLREGGEAWLRERLDQAGRSDADVVVLDPGRPGGLRRWAVSARPDLIVTVERRGVARLLWGRLAGGLSRNAPCPVLVIAQRPRSVSRPAVVVGLP